jgi:hypothetical protein
MISAREVIEDGYELHRLKEFYKWLNRKQDPNAPDLSHIRPMHELDSSGRCVVCKWTRRGDYRYSPMGWQCGIVESQKCMPNHSEEDQRSFYACVKRDFFTVKP